jgi:hypothetical protein
MANHLFFSPGGDHDGGASSQRQAAVPVRDPACARLSRTLQPDPAEIERDVVGCTEKKPERREQQKSLLNKLQKFNRELKRIRKMHIAPHPR